MLKLQFVRVKFFSLGIQVIFDGNKIIRKIYKTDNFEIERN